MCIKLNVFSASGVISREELRFFYTSFLGFDSRKVDEALTAAYDAMTAVS